MIKSNIKQITIFSAIAFLLCALIWGFTSKQTSSQKQLALGKSRFVEFDTGKYVSIYETTNREFKKFLKGLSSDELRKRYKPDSTLWVKMLKTGLANLPMTQVYSSHEKYNDYPVTCISKEAMMAFCDWKTAQQKPDGNQSPSAVFRLPSSEEWQIFASPLLGYSYPWSQDQPYVLTNRNGTIEALANLKIYDYAHGQFNYMFDHALYPNRVDAYPPNSIGLFNIIGNVAEYTSDNLSKGGGCDNTMEESAVHRSQDYALPNPFVGFRVVMEVKTK